MFLKNGHKYNYIKISDVDNIKKKIDINWEINNNQTFDEYW